jgi:hypothetical protein
VPEQQNHNDNNNHKELIMSVQNSAIELSCEELDLVAGGAITSTEAASFLQKENALASSFNVGAYGTTSFTAAVNNTTQATGAKTVTIS